MERKLLEIAGSISLIFLIAAALTSVALLWIFGISLARGQIVDSTKVYPVLKPCLYETCHLSDTSHGAIANIPLPKCDVGWQLVWVDFNKPMCARDLKEVTR